MKLVRLKKIDKLVRNSNDPRLLNEFLRLRNELLNESPKYDEGDAEEEVEEMSLPIIHHLCKMWLFFADSDQVNGWVNELVVKYPRAPRYGDRGKVLDKDSVERNLWNSRIEATVDSYLKNLLRSEKYSEMPRRSYYTSFVHEFKKRLKKFYGPYSESLSKAGSNFVSQSKIKARVGERRYKNLSKQDKKNEQPKNAFVTADDFWNALDSSNLLYGYGSDEYYYESNSES